MFSVGAEANVPTFYSAIQLLLSAVLLLIITKEKFLEWNRFRFAWAGLAAGFVFLGFDEVAMFHEKIYKLPALLGFGEVPLVWLVLFCIPLLLLAAGYWRFFWALESWMRRMFLLSACIFLGGAIGMEVIGDIIWYQTGTKNCWPYILEESVEELMEMIGIFLFILTLLKYLETKEGAVTIEFQP